MGWWEQVLGLGEVLLVGVWPSLLLPSEAAESVAVAAAAAVAAAGPGC